MSAGHQYSGQEFVRADPTELVSLAASQVRPWGVLVVELVGRSALI